MSTFFKFNSEQCIGKKFRWTCFDIYCDNNGSNVFEGVVTSVDEDALYSGDRVFLMKDLELADAILEWIDEKDDEFVEDESFTCYSCGSNITRFSCLQKYTTGSDGQVCSFPICPICESKV